jgi:hypothetical protein
LDSFVSACQRSASKRKRGEASNVSGNEFLIISNVEVSLKEGFSNTSKI